MLAAHLSLVQFGWLAGPWVLLSFIGPGSGLRYFVYLLMLCYDRQRVQLIIHTELVIENTLDRLVTSIASVSV